MENLTNKYGMSPEMVMIILGFLLDKQSKKCPFPEEQSYHARSVSYCTHVDGLELLEQSIFSVDEKNRKKRSSKIFKVDERTRKILSDVDKYYHVSYLYSAIYSQIYEMKDTEKWREIPLYGMYFTFSDLWRNTQSDVVPYGRFLKCREFTKDPLIISIHDKWKGIKEGVRGVFNFEKVKRSTCNELLFIVKHAKDEIAYKLQKSLQE